MSVSNRALARSQWWTHRVAAPSERQSFTPGPAVAAASTPAEAAPHALHQLHGDGQHKGRQQGSHYGEARDGGCRRPPAHLSRHHQTMDVMQAHHSTGAVVPGNQAEVLKHASRIPPTQQTYCT